MYRPLAIYIGLRYARSKRRHHFISLISLIAMLGIVLGVIVLITVLSVLNGFDREIKKQIFGMISPLTMSSYTGQIDDWPQLEKILLTSPDVTAVAPFISSQALLTQSGLTQPALLTGIIPDKEKKISALSHRMTKGHLLALKPGQMGIILGEDLAHRLDVHLGDHLIVAIPNAAFSTTSITPHLQKFTVVGLFHAGGGGFNFDSKLAFIHLADAQSLFHLGSAITALHINIKNIYAAPLITKQLQNELPTTIRISNWTEQLSAFFENIRLTKTIMFFIFILIIAVAAFNLICMMVMVVKNKRADIAILRTLGATPIMILMLFIVQGAAIGIGGILFGIMGGVALAWSITDIANWIQAFFHVQLISSNIYFVNYLPSELRWLDVWYISIATFSLNLLATLYPAWHASRLEPVEGLRVTT